MKNTVLKFGLLSGATSVILMALSVPLIRAERMGLADLSGYSSMLLSALLIYFGIRSYRERVGQGRLTFRKGFAVGALITLISCTCFVIAFQVLYFKIAPDFGDLFSACMVKRVQAEGGSAEEIAKTAEQAATLKRLYDQPLTNAAVALGTSLPIGLAASALAALILRKR